MPVTPDLRRDLAPPLVRADGVPAARWWEPAVLPGRWTAVVLGATASLLVLHLLVSLMRLQVGDFPLRDPVIRLFRLDAEGGLPAWFTSLLLFLVAQALWRLGEESTRSARRRWVRHERVLSIVFVYLSIDELTALHEQTIAPLREGLDLDGLLYYSWVVVFVPLAALLAVFFAGWLRDLPPVAARLIVVSGLLYVGGAAGVEVVGGLLNSRGLADTMLYSGAVALEEGLEMVGALLMLSAVTWLGGTRGRPPAPAMTGPSTGLLD